MRTVDDIPEDIRRRFPEFCRLVAENLHLPRLPDGYVIDAVYTGLDDVPCESHKQDYYFGINLRPAAKFTTAMIFFNQELVFAWYGGRTYIDRMPENFTLSFETTLGAKYRQSEPEIEEEEEVNPDPIDLGTAYYEPPTQSVTEEERRARKIADEIMAQAYPEPVDFNTTNIHLERPAWSAEDEEQLQRARQIADEVMARAIADEIMNAQ